MAAKTISQGVVHRVPSDLKSVLLTKKGVYEKWESLTPLARNEWICWIEDAKKVDTRERKIVRIQEDLLNGKRRPCCWPGCPHRVK